MKRICVLAMLLAATLSCSFFRMENVDRGNMSDNADCGTLCMMFCNDASSKAADIEFPDTNSFHLSVRNAEGGIVFDGLFGDFPEAFPLENGAYDISVASPSKTEPEFDNPVWGDEQCAVINAPGTTFVKLICRQINCGVKLDICPEFLTAFPDAVLFLGNDKGKLMYGYSEYRTAFFCPGPVSLIMSRGDKDEKLLTRNLAAGEILCLKIITGEGTHSGSGQQTEGLSIQIDTARTYVRDIYSFDSEVSEKGSSPDKALTVSQAVSVGERKDVWVGGYIVGGDLSTKSMSVKAPFSSVTNLALGPKSCTTAKNVCLAIQLPAGRIRESLNLPEHPELQGRYILLKGNIVPSYFGIAGLKNVSDFLIK